MLLPLYVSSAHPVARPRNDVAKQNLRFFFFSSAIEG